MHEKQVLLLICALRIAAQGNAGQQQGKKPGCCSRHHLNFSKQQKRTDSGQIDCSKFNMTSTYVKLYRFI